MTPKEVKEKYKTGYAFHQETGMSANTFDNWMKWGFVPELSQLKLERITKGELKADFAPFKKGELNASDFEAYTGKRKIRPKPKK